jgi:peptide/nickel transport system permease protein
LVDSRRPSILSAGWLIVLAYATRRLLGMLPMLVGVSMVSFAVIRLAPGKPTDQAEMFMNARVDPTVYARLQEIYGLDKPLPVQYWNWLGRVARLDFGLSMSLDRRPVLDKIVEALPITVALNAVSMTLVLIIAIPIGVISAAKPGSLLDRALTVFVFLGFSTPAFWLALMLMIVLGVQLQWLPISWAGMPRWGQVSTAEYLIELLRHGAIPMICYTFGGLAALSRYMRAGTREALSQDYVLTARAKGLRPRAAVWGHAVPNALLPIITILGLMVPGIIGGSVILEQVFAIPGMGRLIWEAVVSRDYTLIMGELTIVAVLTLVGNLLADLGYGLADPRIRQQTEGLSGS